MKREKVLILEEDETRRRRLSRLLSELDIDIVESGTFSEARNYLFPPQSFFMATVGLPLLDESHIKNLQCLKESDPELSLVLISKVQKSETALFLLDKGIVDYISSYNDPGGILSAVKNGFGRKKLVEKNEVYRRSLRQIKTQQKKNHRRAEDIEEIYESTLENLMTALDLRDVETFGHSRTVSKYSEVLSQLLGIKGKTTLDNIKKGALLHDVGKIAIPDSILKKPSSLSPLEWEKIKLHPSLGFGLIKEINLVKEIGNIILYHHERYDGNGYPVRLKKKEIPVEARIFALADALDAITSHRPYRKERGFEAAKKEIQDNSGTQFDPKVVEAFSSYSLDKWKKIRYETTQFIPSVEYMREISKI